MLGHTFFGKQKLCYTEVSDFTDYQGIGYDPMYKRYDSVFSVVKKSVPADFQHFFATPEYLDDEDRICWHIDAWEERPIRLTDLAGAEYAKYKAIFDDTVRTYKSAVMNLNGEDLQIMAGAIKYIDEDRVYCGNDKVWLVAWGMTPDTHKHKVVGSVIHDLELVKRYKITFDAGEHGSLAKLDKSISKVGGSEITDADLPTLTIDDGWCFLGWSPSPVGQEVNSDMHFTAQYSKVQQLPPDVPVPEVDYFNCEFDAAGHGKIQGESNIRKEAGSTLTAEEIPTVTPDKGYKFKGWNISPVNALVDGNKLFTAQYVQKRPWYRRWWFWLLAGLLLTLLLALLFRGCGHSLLFSGCSGPAAVNGVAPIGNITLPGGGVADDNGFVHPITGSDGRLPDGDWVVAPVMGEGGEEPPIIKRPDAPDIIANRLFLFLEDENGDVDALARDFKKAYPDDKYSIIGFDREVKMLVIQIPEAERDDIRNTINSKIPNHKFIVFDEEVYENDGDQNETTDPPGWHLDAINLKQGWNYTKGSPNVKVAVVDDGIQADHPMFKGRIVDAYNVFTQNNSLSLGDGHGTHTAGLAAGSDEFYSEGASGVAPNCKLMPIQVFDNDRCPLTALIAGVMYAIHHDADVVNISVGPSFKDKGLNVLPVDEQKRIAESRFKNVALLWARVCKLAAKKNTILVFAAGNDDILTSIPPENRNASSIVVTAVDIRMYPTRFTNYGTCSDVSAPGKDILSAFPNNSFEMLEGTSMAAPIVTGTVALMKSLKKDLTVEQARNALYSTGADVYGWIPPMVLVDKVLAATKKGDFQRIKREGRSVPDGVDVHLNSGIVPVDGSQDDIDTYPAPAQPAPVQGNETDYDAVRKQIAEYKKKIEQLEQLLPKQ